MGGIEDAFDMLFNGIPSPKDPPPTPEPPPPPEPVIDDDSDEERLAQQRSSLDARRRGVRSLRIANPGVSTTGVGAGLRI